jgi:cytochrome P450
MDTRTSQRTGGSYAGTTFYEDRGPSVDDMPWCTSYADVEHVFRSQDWVQGGGGARDSYEFIGDGLLALSGADHFQRRRIEAPLFRKPDLHRYEEDILLPVLRERLGAAREQGQVRLELRSLMRSCLYRVSAEFVGLDGVDDSVLGQYLELIEQLSIGANMEWVVSDHREAVAQALVHKAAFMERFFRPSWERRADLVARFGRGELADDDLPLRLHPPTPFFIRRAARDTTLPSGLGASAGDYIVLDIIAASHDQSAFGNDADDFNPYRGRNKGVKSTGIAFGGGVHTCIAMSMTIGDPSGAREDSAEQVGLMVACLRELYQRGMRPDSENVPEKSGVNMRDEYASYWVVLDT